MTLTAAVLLIISALAHAGWNLFSKTDHPSSASFLLANLFGTTLLVPFLVFGRAHVLGIIEQFWLLLVLTGFFQALYFAGLAFAYKKGELSVSYPLARSLPTLLVTIVVFAFGQGGTIGRLALFGMALIVAGGFLIPLQSFRDFSLKRYKSVGVIAALVAAIGTAGYSMVDDFTLALIRSGHSVGLNDNFIIALYYICLQGLTTVLWQAMMVLPRAKERQLFLRQTAHPVPSIIKGAGIFLTYGLVLVSMGYVTNVSYVVAFRQLSIPIGLVFGILILKERACGPKIAAVILLFSGVVLVGLG